MTLQSLDLEYTFLTVAKNSHQLYSLHFVLRIFRTANSGELIIGDFIQNWEIGYFLGHTVVIA